MKSVLFTADSQIRYGEHCLCDQLGTMCVKHTKNWPKKPLLVTWLDHLHLSVSAPGGYHGGVARGRGRSDGLFPSLVTSTSSWHACGVSHIRPVPATSIYLTIVGAEALGYRAITQVGEMLVGYLSPGTSSSLEQPLSYSGTGSDLFCKPTRLACSRLAGPQFVSPCK